MYSDGTLKNLKLRVCKNSSCNMLLIKIILIHIKTLLLYKKSPSTSHIIIQAYLCKLAMLIMHWGIFRR